VFDWVEHLVDYLSRPRWIRKHVWIETDIDEAADAVQGALGFGDERLVTNFEERSGPTSRPAFRPSRTRSRQWLAASERESGLHATFIRETATSRPSLMRWMKRASVKSDASNGMLLT